MSGLGRIHAPDPRDYPLSRSAAALPPTTPLPAYWYWRAPSLPLDQGATPMCVGYSSRGLLNAAPVLNEHGPSAADIYHGAQANDEWDGTNYDGTSARGAMKYLRSLGYISAYVWAQSVDEAARWVAYNGPMLLGLTWLTSYDDPGPSGVLKRTPTATVRGGHEVLVIGLNSKRALFRCMNSWGSWSQHGRFWVPFELMDQILGEDADLVTPTEILVPA